jgi:flagellar motor switch/type III secretory pathway protein FliN
MAFELKVRSEFTEANRVMSMVGQSAEPRNFEAAPKAVISSEGDRLEMVSLLPFTLTLEIPVVRFTIQDLLSLKIGTIVETACHQTSDIPLRVNGILLGWTEFDMVGDRLAVRITEQA